MAERIHLVPPFRRRLVNVPLGLDHPYWIDDPDFDLDFHIRHIAVAPPGDAHQLADLAARSRRAHLDRARPLWEMYVIEGLEGGYVAELTKIHHACIDGVSGAEDPRRAPRRRAPPAAGRAADPPWQPEHQPSSVDMLGRGALGLLSRPRVGLRATRKALRNGPALRGNFGVRIAPPWPAQLLSRPSTSTPQVPFSGMISAHRRFAFGSLPLSGVKAVKEALGGTVNDVVMAMCAGALRRWLLDHDALPDGPLHAMVPISVRTPEQVGTFGNRVSAMVAELPTDEPDPVAGDHRMHDAMGVCKEQHNAYPADILQDFAEFAPPSVLGAASRVIARAPSSWAGCRRRSTW